MTHAKPLCVVMGGGVSGLSCAVLLLEQGWDVHVFGKDVGGSDGEHLACAGLTDLVSQGAGAVWEYPPFQVEPMIEAKAWARATLPCLLELAREPHVTGVLLRRLNFLWRTRSEDDQRKDAAELSGVLPHFRQSEGVFAEAGEGFTAGYSYEAPVAWMPRYLLWLHSKVRQLGGTLHAGEDCIIHSLSQQEIAGLLRRHRLDQEALHLVVNCLALSCKDVVPDPGVFPIRGVLVLVHCPSVQACFFDEDDPNGCSTYVIPQGTTGVVACGGLAQPHKWETHVLKEEALNILARCQKLVPALVGSPVVGTWAGLRPGRSAEAGGIRVQLQEVVTRSQGGDHSNHMSAPVVHNYGHGGSGLICSWGCAADVANYAKHVAAQSSVVLNGLDASHCLFSRQLGCALASSRL